MTDVFKEQIVKREPAAKEKLMRIGLILAVAVVFVISIMFFWKLAVAILAVAAFGAYWLMSFLNMEYEYSVTNGELDIDVIYSRSRRKQVFSGNITDFEIMAHTEDKIHAGDFNSAQEIKDYSSGKAENNKYAFLTTYKGKRVKVIFEPNDVLLKAIATVLPPRKLFRNRSEM